MSGIKKSVDNYFGITSSGSKFSVETIAGLTTFFTMAYIMFVNPSILGDDVVDGVMIGAGIPTKAVIFSYLFLQRLSAPL